MSCKKRLEHRQKAIELQEKQQKRVFSLLEFSLIGLKKPAKKAFLRLQRCQILRREELITILF
jgi:hypothetical protein